MGTYVSGIALCVGVLRGAVYPAWVSGTHICGAGAGTRRAMRAIAGRARVELCAGAGAR